MLNGGKVGIKVDVDNLVKFNDVHTSTEGLHILMSTVAKLKHKHTHACK